MGCIQLMSRGRRRTTTHPPTHTNLSVISYSTSNYSTSDLTHFSDQNYWNDSEAGQHLCNGGILWVLVTNCWSQTWRLRTLPASFFCTDSLSSSSRWSVLIISLSKWTANFPLLHPPSKSSWQPPFLFISPPFLLFILYCIPLAKSKVYSVIFQRETNMQTPCPFFLAGGIHK